MGDVVLASNNAGKVVEFQQLLAGVGFYDCAPKPI